MKQCSFILFVLLTCVSIGNAQTSIPVELLFGKKKLRLHEEYSINDSTKIEFSTVRFYLSNAEVFFNGNTEKMKESALLMEAESKNFIQFENTITSFDSIRFLLGTDYETNTSGVLEGDLDPINGMYWAWNSGYINVKLEGKWSTKAGSKSFEFHLGGYEEPNATARTISMVNTRKKIKVISIDFSTFFSLELVQQHSSILIPGPEAVEMMNSLSLSLNE